MSVERLLLLSGPICAGKTSIAAELHRVYGFEGIKSSDFLRELCEERGISNGRTDLQNLGDELDTKTGYAWIVDRMAIPAMAVRLEVKNWYLDSVRKSRQVEHFRSRLPEVTRHVHLFAPEEVLQSRFNIRERKEGVSYLDAIQHPNEVSARSLASIADASFNTTSLSVQEIASLIYKSWS